MTAPYEAVSFDRGESFRAVVAGQLQRPDFNCRGAALAFASAVSRGVRKPEPVGEAIAKAEGA